MSRNLCLLVLSYFSLLFVSCNCQCRPSCGNLNISYPFRLIGDPISCGHPNYELSCDDYHTILRFGSGEYFVKSISYDNFTMRILNPGLLSESSDICNQSYDESHYWRNSSVSYQIPYKLLDIVIYFLSCQIQVDSPQYVDYTQCVNNSNPSNMYFYAVSGDMTLSDLKESCSIINSLFYYDTKYIYGETNFTYNSVWQRVQKGIELDWTAAYCGSCWHRNGQCFPPMIYSSQFHCDAECSEFETLKCYDYALTTKQLVAKFLLINWLKIRVPLACFLGGRALCGGLCFFIFFIYKFRQRHLSFDEGIEDFLQSHNYLGSIRYSYSDLKKITNNFKEKLGQGGFGSVFKGKLQSGHFVAVKVLEKSKSNGQDFMSEVATIGRIHHVNVVQLSGFCVEGSKRALIYDFMPKGSLEKYIQFPEEEQSLYLSWKKMYEIAVGVANGIEYLHRGCEMQILHFDIKPHNILLDNNFNPRISDFGLAKLYKTNDSIVSLTAVRGTIGYMAPELFYKNIGGVSNKADVYSFGMLIMEMAGRRRNLNVHAESSSQIYFPLWVFEQLSQGKEMEIGYATEKDKIIAKKLAMVGLWCIQMKPADRPSMSKVVEMLKGDIEVLQMPPKLSLVPEDRVVDTFR